MKNEMKKIYYQVVENVLPQVYLLYNSFNNKFILLNNVRYEKYKKEKEKRKNKQWIRFFLTDV